MASLAVFDLDGTLTNPIPGLISCHSWALDQVGRNFEDLVSEANLELDNSVRSTAITLYGVLGLADAQAVEAAQHFKERRPVSSLMHSPLYEGVEPLLDELTAAGWILGLATTQLDAIAERTLRRLGIHDQFVAIVGSDIGRTRTTKSDVITHLLTTLDDQPEGVVVVGDRAADIDAAKKVKATGIGAAWGFGSIDELIAANADAIAVTPAEVGELLVGKEE